MIRSLHWSLRVYYIPLSLYLHARTYKDCPFSETTHNWMLSVPPFSIKEMSLLHLESDSTDVVKREVRGMMCSPPCSFPQLSLQPLPFHVHECLLRFLTGWSKTATKCDLLHSVVVHSWAFCTPLKGLWICSLTRPPLINHEVTWIMSSPPCGADSWVQRN